MFSAMTKAKGKKGVATMHRSARAPSRLAEEAPPTAPEDDSSPIAELQAQMRRANTARPDAATASTSALDADVTELPSMSAALVPGAHSGDLMPMLPPAPTTSQDLMANILHQMTTPTTAGDHEGTAEGGIARFFVLGQRSTPR